MNNLNLWKIVFPSVAGIICIIGLIVDSLLNRQPNEALVALASAFAGWAFGAGLANLGNGNGSKSNDPTKTGG